jgi:hypothetical protein
MYSLPSNNNLSISRLTQIFNITAASYKFYWFISFLQLFAKNKNVKRIDVRDILIQMICNAWYPVVFFKLSFGYSDQLQKNITKIRKKLNISQDISLDELFVLLKKNEDKTVNGLITHFNQQVPYRFLSPWIEYINNRDVIKRSQQLENNCIYSLLNDNELQIEINPLWKDYLFGNNKILLDFAFWRLTLYVQVFNPNIPNVPQKLIKPVKRESLSNQKKFWKIVFEKENKIECIYTGKSLTWNNFDMEHFIPWSFVLHNQMWNLLPADSSINSSKSNKLPSLNRYIKPFVEIQREAINIVFEKNPKNKMLEDYLFIEGTIQGLLNLSEKELVGRFKNTLEPLIQIASNSGFEQWVRK